MKKRVTLWRRRRAIIAPVQPPSVHSRDHDGNVFPGGSELPCDDSCKGNTAASLLTEMMIQQDSAAKSLCILSMNDCERQNIAAAGGVAAMIKLLSSNVHHTRLMAVGTIANLAISIECHSDIFEAGGLNHLSSLANDPDDRIQSAALGALCNLAQSSHAVPAILQALELAVSSQTTPRPEKASLQRRRGLSSLVDSSCSPLRPFPSFGSPVRFNATTGVASPPIKEENETEAIITELSNAPVDLITACTSGVQENRRNSSSAVPTLLIDSAGWDASIWDPPIPQIASCKATKAARGLMFRRLANAFLQIFCVDPTASWAPRAHECLEYRSDSRSQTTGVRATLLSLCVMHR
jgi:hypothetical protein